MIRNNMTITRTEAAKLIRDYDSSKIFSVTFVKRTNGEVRTLVGRKGVQKGVKGIGLAFDPLTKGLVGIFDMAKDAFRFINLETIISIRLEGNEYTIKG
jgi:hypothetical protein